jgi:hypothetical protein
MTRAILFILLCAGCSDSAGPDLLANVERDTGTNTPSDSGMMSVDFGMPVDLGMPVDMGQNEDAPADTGVCECSPAEVQTLLCGACDSGTQVRTCEADCTWGLSSACAGADFGFPVDANTGASVCPPYNQPAVFFAPHPDDETIGYAANIAEHVQTGRDVFIELMTHGRATGVRTTLGNGGTDPWHPGTHGYTLTPDEIGNARIAEFTQAAIALGVTGIKVSDFGDGNLTQAEVTQRISWWIAHNPGGMSLKGTAGDPDPTTVGGAPHRDHKAVWDALVASGFGDLRGWLVYHYSTGTGTFARQNTFLGQPACDAKRAALGAYKVWDPPNNRFAIGYHSVAGLIDTASASCVEYTVVP